MVQVQIVEKPAFWVMGKKTWIEKVEDFGSLWASCAQDGTLERLRERAPAPGPVTGGYAFGVSRVESDPANRTFDFFVAVEVEEGADIPAGMESFRIKGGAWAVFEAEGGMLEALYAEEMYAFSTWLPASGYVHAFRPELEVYPVSGAVRVQFWLPIER